MIATGALARHNRLDDITVGDVLDAHLAHLERTSTRGVKNTGEANLLKLHLGDTTPLSDVDHSTLVQFCRTRARVDKVQPSTVHHNMMFFAGAISTAVIDLGVPKSYQDELVTWLAGLSRAQLIGLPQRRDRRPTPAEIERLRHYFVDHFSDFKLPYLDLMEFAIESAMRLSEICSLRFDDFDPEAGVILVRQRKHPTMKRYNDQRVPLLGEAQAIIERRPRVGELIFPYVPESVSNGFRRACRELKIEGLTFHDLRHEGVSRLFEQGYGIEEVAMVSGHRDWGSLKRYANLRPTELVKKDRLRRGE